MKNGIALFSLLIILGLVGHLDYVDEMKMELAHKEKMTQLAADYCLPRLGQHTVIAWHQAGDEDQLACAIYEESSQVGEPRVVLTEPAKGLGRLALFQGSN
jgi:hypothetical protein